MVSEDRKTITVEFSEKEMAAMLALLDLAAKAGGLQVAEACAALLTKFREANTERNEYNGKDSSGSSGDM